MKGLENDITQVITIANELKRTLFKLEFYLELYRDYSSEEGIDMFIDCKFQQQNALDYANDILKLLNPLENA